MDLITEQLNEALSEKGMIAVVETHLLKELDQLKQKLPVDNVLSYIVEKDGFVTFDKVAAIACLSMR